MTELKLGNDPVGVASSHQFDIHPDETRSGNNPFQPVGPRQQAAEQIRSVTIVQRGRQISSGSSERTRRARVARRSAVEPHKGDMMRSQRAVAAACKWHHDVVEQ